MADITLETGCFQSESGQKCEPSGSGALLILEKITRKKGKLPLVFACVLQNAPRSAEDLWRRWFWERALPLCERGDAERCVERILADFAGHFAEYSGIFGAADEMSREPEGIFSMAALFVMGNECFYAWRGATDIRLLNDCFGRLHMRRLAPQSDELCCRRAVLESGVGVLLGSAAFFEYLPEPVLKECLAVQELRGQGRVERRLTEAAGEAKRRGAADFAVVMLVTDGEQHEEFRELLEAGGYEKAALVGSGAFGHVYRVRKRHGGSCFACKLAEGRRARTLLKREAELQSSLEHPLFARYVDLLEGQYTTALFMEYVRGRDLTELLRRGHLAKRQAVDIARQLAEGLLYLHDREEPVLYRDLKPGNVRVGAGGRVKLLDLGCACRLSEVGKAKAGSRGYAAPEQFGEAPGAAGRVYSGVYSDVYAWGRVLADMLGGTEDAALASLIEACTRDAPGQRPQNMRVVLEELNKIFV